MAIGTKTPEVRGCRAEVKGLSDQIALHVIDGIRAREEIDSAQDKPKKCQETPRQPGSLGVAFFEASFGKLQAYRPVVR